MTETIAEIRARQLAEEKLYDVLVDRLTDLTPIPARFKASARAAFANLSRTDLVTKVNALECDMAAKIARKALPAIQAAQQKPVHHGLEATLPLLDAMIDIAHLTSHCLMRYFNTRAFDVTLKPEAGNTPVTTADPEAESIILAGLRNIAANVPFVGEESYTQLDTAKIDWNGAFWCTDPLDGTKNFIEGYDTFSTNIALVKNHRAVAGVVHVPARGITWAGLPELGIAFKIDADGRIPVTTQVHAPDQRTAVRGYATYAEDAINAFHAAHGVKHVFYEASAARLCAIADGRADVYLQPVPFSDWDNAASQAVIEAAGGVLVDRNGNPLRYGYPDRKFETPVCMAAASPHLLVL